MLAPAFAPPPSCGPAPSGARAAPRARALCRRRVLQVAAAALLASRARAAPAAAEPGSDYVRAPSGLEVRDYRVGAGRAVVVGDTVVLKWTGRLADRFGWSFQREDAGEVSLVVGAGDDFMQGFREGIAGDGGSIPPMHEGGKRRIIIPKEMGYKREGQKPVPTDYGDRRRLYSTVLNTRRPISAGALVVDVELRKLRR